MIWLWVTLGVLWCACGFYFTLKERRTHSHGLPIFIWIVFSLVGPFIPLCQLLSVEL